MGGGGRNGEDKGFWSAYAKGVEPLKKVPQDKRKAPPRQKVKIAEKIKQEEKAALSASPSPPVKTALVHLDRTLERNLKKGEVIIEARLDLHGMTQAEAHAALNAFMMKAVKARRKCVLVITGKGLGGEGRGGRDGVLKTNTPRWLAEPALAPHVLAIREAAPQHGGSGALYVLLRKPL
jgi:DNA-nicking Smr family endonuclease